MTIKLILSLPVAGQVTDLMLWKYERSRTRFIDDLNSRIQRCSYQSSQSHIAKMWLERRANAGNISHVPLPRTMGELLKILNRQERLDESNKESYRQELSKRIFQEKRHSFCMLLSHLATLVTGAALMIFGARWHSPLGMTLIGVSGACIIFRINRLSRAIHAQSL
jgi:hypothetical protein